MRSGDAGIANPLPAARQAGWSVVRAVSLCLATVMCPNLRRLTHTPGRRRPQVSGNRRAAVEVMRLHLARRQGDAGVDLVEQVRVDPLSQKRELT
jgi:hypothetical protein